MSNEVKKMLVPLANGFEEIEFVSIVDTLRRAGVEVVIAGVGKPHSISGAGKSSTDFGTNAESSTGAKNASAGTNLTNQNLSGAESAGIYTGSHGIEIRAEVCLEALDSGILAGFDGVALAGGWQGMLNLKASEKLREILRDFKAQNKLVSAICASPIVLDSAGVLEGKFACYPSCEKFAESDSRADSNEAGEKPLNGEYQPNASVVRAGNLITAAGPATGILFALEIISYLLGQAKSNEIAEQMLVPYLKSNAKIVRE